MQTRPEKLIRWFIFSVLIALTPLFVGYLSLWLDQKEPSMHLITARGELLLVSTTIGSTAIGELLPGDRRNAALKLVAGGSCVFLMLLSTFCFAAIQGRRNPDVSAIFATSVAMFCGTFLTSLGAVYLAYEGEQP